MKKAEKFELTFLKKEKISKDAFSFYFDRVHVERGLGKRSSSEKFDFKPGQYLKLYLSIENPDARGTSRYFTISSSPSDKDFITISTRIIKSSFKLKLNSLIPGEKIRAFGPIGYFDFNQKSKKQNIFVSGGMGITPFHSILKFVDSKKIDPNIVLIASFSIEEEVIFYDELKNIESRNSNIKVIYTLTKDKNLNKGFENGRINEQKITKYSKNYKKAKYFIVGPEIFEQSMFEVIKGMGIKEEEIFKENFPGY